MPRDDPDANADTPNRGLAVAVSRAVMSAAPRERGPVALVNDDVEEKEEEDEDEEEAEVSKMLSCDDARMWLELGTDKENEEELVEEDEAEDDERPRKGVSTVGASSEVDTSNTEAEVEKEEASVIVIVDEDEAAVVAVLETFFLAVPRSTLFTFAAKRSEHKDS